MTGAHPAAPPVAVVITSKNEPSLTDTLTSVYPQAVAAGAAVIVVDASGTRLNHIRRMWPQIVWIPYIHPAGKTVTIAEQRNLGVRIAGAHGATIVAFCDCGSTVADDWLPTLTGPIEAGDAHATCGPIDSARPGPPQVNTAPAGTEAHNVPTANLAFSITAWDRISGFDETFDYGSDLDFTWRLSDAGMPVITTPARLTIDWGTPTRNLRRSWLYGRAQTRLWRKHRHRWKQLPTVAPTLAVYPTLLVVAVAAVTAATVQRRPAPLAIPAVAVLALLTKNRGRPFSVLQNVVFGAGALSMLGRRTHNS